MVDRVQVQQILVNLLRNAMDAMQGSSRRELILTTRSNSEGMVEIVVVRHRAGDRGGGG